MERKKQIEFRAGSTRDGLIANYVPTEQAFVYEDGFKDGANWADKTMLDRACEWLKKNIDLYAYESSNTHYPEIKLTECFETAFRQAMGGGADDVR